MSWIIKTLALRGADAENIVSHRWVYIDSKHSVREYRCSCCKAIFYIWLEECEVIGIGQVHTQYESNGSRDYIKSCDSEMMIRALK